MAPKKTKKAPAAPFSSRLVLFEWALFQFNAARFEDLATLTLKDESLEGEGDSGQSRYLEHLLALDPPPKISEEDLSRYDLNIRRHTGAIAKKRPITWKYFQYLCLLFVEIYLDKYFRDPGALCEELNQFLIPFNQARPTAEPLPTYTPEDLSKLAFWNATGSGKTLLMHVHLLQYELYRVQAGKGKANNLLLLTPTEGLSRQHLEELELSGIDAAVYDKRLSRGGQEQTHQILQVIEISKLQEKDGDKTVAFESFSGNNLLLVDEGHRGAEGEAWMKYRRALCADGFSFEYSATFGQAVGKGPLAPEYAKCILYDYSYSRFYKDGFGKDYRILNLDQKGQAHSGAHFTYLTGALLTFWQQLRYFEEKKDQLGPFLIERPLWIVVGAKVNAPTSDVVDVLRFFGHFLTQPKLAQKAMEQVFGGTSGILVNGADPFSKSLGYLQQPGLSTADLYHQLCTDFFHGQGKLHIDLTNKAEGEMVLRAGDAEAPFGVINIGDVAKVFNLIAGRKKGASAEERAVAKEFETFSVTQEKATPLAYFAEISKPHSPINLLIGAKKFIEGWSSWRVSCIGLMRVGQSEGPQIIQLFGRGVRLRGYGYKLKRSSHLGALEVPKPTYLPMLETLNVFGVQAGYMKTFNEMLLDEDCDPNSREIEVELPLKSNLPKAPQLWQPRLPHERKFLTQGERIEVGLLDDYFSTHKIIIDWYPKIQGALRGLPQGETEQMAKEKAQFSKGHLGLLNWDQIYFELQRFKAEKGWYNLSLGSSLFRQMFEYKEVVWYQILIPRDQMKLTSLAQDLPRWQEIAVAILKKYLERLYYRKKSEWEQQKVQAERLAKGDLNLPESQLFKIKPEQVEVLAGIQALDKKTQAKTAAWEGFRFPKNQPDIEVFMAQRHLYEPLVYLNKAGAEVITLDPAGLNEGEAGFVNDLHQYLSKNPKATGEHQLFLLRNQSKGRGVGFFEEGGFYPDFILWLVKGKRQEVAFIDPKGLQHMHGQDFTRKIGFHKKVKELEAKVEHPEVEIKLHSFILSSTELAALKRPDGPQNLAEFNEQNVFFVKEQTEDYVGKLLFQILGGASA